MKQLLRGFAGSLQKIDLAAKVMYIPVNEMSEELHSWHGCSSYSCGLALFDSKTGGPLPSRDSLRAGLLH